MGFPNVSIVDGGTTAWTARGLELATGSERIEPFGLAEARASIPGLSPAELQSRLDAMTVLFVGTSREFAQGHVPGAHWVSRSWLELRVSASQQEAIVTTDVGGQSAALAAYTLSRMGYPHLSYLTGGMRAWQQAGMPVERGLTRVMQPPDDVVPSGLERSAAEAIEYLRWETALGTRPKNR